MRKVRLTYHDGSKYEQTLYEHIDNCLRTSSGDMDTFYEAQRRIESLEDALSTVLGILVDKSLLTMEELKNVVGDTHRYQTIELLPEGWQCPHSVTIELKSYVGIQRTVSLPRLRCQECGEEIVRG
jgi:hypothetical protein